MHIPEHPSHQRKILFAPATALYAAGSWLHRRVWLRLRIQVRRGEESVLPVIVIGSLRAGGAGKTPVVLELARHLSEQGLRVGVLGYRLGVSGRSLSHEPCEVFPDSDWRETSDEAVMLARELAAQGVRIFVTRNRARAREMLSQRNEFDVLISDDGLMDPRLTDSSSTLRVALVRPDERPGWMDLLPAGPYRLTLSALRSVDCVLREGEDFKRTLVAHQNGLPNAPAWLLTGMGNPDHFHRALTHLGFRILGGSYGPDHGCPDLTRASDDARAAGAERFLCSLKDWIKLEKHPNRPQNLSCIREIVTLSTPFLGRATAFSRSPTS